MSLTDQQVSDNFDLLMTNYCTLNNVTVGFGSAQSLNGLKEIVWYSELTQVPAPTYDTLRVYNLTTLKQAQKQARIQSIFDNADENDIRFTKMAKGTLSMFRNLLVNPLAPAVGITNAQAIAIISNQFGIPQQQIINMLNNPA